MSGKHKSKGTTEKEVTDGIDIETWVIKHSSGKEITFSAWDFAGQSVYYNTHQVCPICDRMIKDLMNAPSNLTIKTFFMKLVRKLQIIFLFDTILNKFLIRIDSQVLASYIYISNIHC